MFFVFYIHATCTEPMNLDERIHASQVNQRSIAQFAEISEIIEEFKKQQNLQQPRIMFDFHGTIKTDNCLLDIFREVVKNSKGVWSDATKRPIHTALNYRNDMSPYGDLFKEPSTLKTLKTLQSKGYPINLCTSSKGGELPIEDDKKAWIRQIIGKHIDLDPIEDEEMGDIGEVYQNVIYSENKGKAILKTLLKLSPERRQGVVFVDDNLGMVNKVVKAFEEYNTQPVEGGKIPLLALHYTYKNLLSIADMRQQDLLLAKISESFFR